MAITDVVLKRIDELEQIRARIQEASNQLRQQLPLSCDQLNYLRSYRSNEVQIYGLNEILGEPILQTLAAKLNDLFEQQILILEMENLLLQGISLDHAQQEILCGKATAILEVEAYTSVLEEFVSLVPDSPEAIRILNTCKDYQASWSSMEIHIDPVSPESLDKNRYMLISNGIDIYYLDLKHWRGEPFSHSLGVPLLPVVHILLDAEEVLFDGPFSPEKHMAYGLLQYRYQAILMGLLQFQVMGETHINLLNLDDSICNISNSKSRFQFPVVENIAGLIHIFGSVYESIEGLVRPHPFWRLSHDVILKITGHKHRIPTIDNEEIKIVSHLVVHRKIFAITDESFAAPRSCLIFDARKFNAEGGFARKRWKWEDNEEHIPSNNHNITTVWDILKRGGYGRCVKQCSLDSEAGPLYMMLALQRDEQFGRGTHMVAYLLTSDGKIVCYQRIRDFFKAAVWPREMVHGTIIDTKERSVCSIVIGSTWDNYNNSDQEYFFINIFGVEENPDALPPIQEVLEEGDWPVEMDFMNVVMKQRYIFQTNAQCKNAWRLGRRLQASFLT